MGAAFFCSIIFLSINRNLNKDEISDTALVYKEAQSHILQGDYFENFKIGADNYDLEYTIDKDLDSYVRMLLKRYKSDYSAVVVIQKDTAEILAAVGYEGTNSTFNDMLAFSSTHPSASLIKIVTAAELLEDSDVDGDQKFEFSGKGSTLYKYQLKEPRARWKRSTTLEKAFAHSNNVVFAKAAIGNLTPEELFKRATLFGFNRNILADIKITPSKFNIAKDNFGFAELASGFNTQTLIGPIHGALLSNIVANNGVFMFPRLIKSIKLNGNVLDTPRVEATHAMAADTAIAIQKMMSRTIENGTARKSFRGMRKRYGEIEMGGKTGSITGGIPEGKRDWFTAYAYDPEGTGIAICVMNINIKKWHVKSSYLSRKIIEYYFSKKRAKNLADKKRREQKIVKL